MILYWFVYIYFILFLFYFTKIHSKKSQSVHWPTMKYDEINQMNRKYRKLQKEVRGMKMEI